MVQAATVHPLLLLDSGVVLNIMLKMPNNRKIFLFSIQFSYYKRTHLHSEEDKEKGGKI